MAERSALVLAWREIDGNEALPGRQDRVGLVGLIGLADRTTKTL
jgi:hypothetical protein